MSHPKFMLAIIMAVMLAAVGVSAAYAYDHNPKEDFDPDCHGQTHDPHKSSAFNQVAVKGWTWCDTNKDFISVYTTLYKWDSGWQAVGTPGYDEEYGGDGTGIESRAYTSPCVSALYRGISIHEVIDGNSGWIDGTGKEMSVTC